MTKIHKKQDNADQNNNSANLHHKSALLPQLAWLRFSLSSLWAVIAGMAIGIAPLVYSNLISEPKLEGRIVAMTTGVGYSSDNKSIISNTTTTHTVFLSIANKKNIPVPIVDYSLELEYENGNKQIAEPIYVKSKSFTLGFDKFQIIIPSTEQHLLNKVNTLVTPQNPISGFISFAGESKPNGSKLKLATITLIDGFGNNHKIKTPVSSFRHPNLLTFLINGCEFRPINQITIDTTGLTPSASAP